MSARAIPWVAAAAVLVAHLIGNPHYGFFRDELYFIICGFHPQFGYVDQPPVIPLLAAFTQSFGHSLFLLRALAALCAAAGVYVTCLLVAGLGGNAFAQVLAALTFFFTSALMAFGSQVTTDSMGLWTWPLIALYVLRIVKGADARLWLAVGAIAGLSIESKYSVLFFLSALILGLLLTPRRRILSTWWLAGGAAIAIAIALPNFIWQWHYGFPMLELLKNGQNGKNIIVGPLIYILQELLITGFFLAAIWIAGLIWLLRNTPARFLAYAYLLLIGEMVLFHGKDYYPADVYPILIAGGAVGIETWTRGKVAPRAIITAAVVLLGLAFTPVTLPILSEQTYVAYARTLHISTRATETEAGREEGALPGNWADMHGWPHLAATVKRVYDSLPPSDRAIAAVFASNYGEAAAIQFFAPGVPVISAHNQYWLWGPRGYDGNVTVVVNGTCSPKYFRSGSLSATIKDPWAISYENNISVWTCRGIREPLAKLWPSIKSYE
jgi:Dolichyl-phosphate-mannose-protein mannosyltransferase